LNNYKKNFKKPKLVEQESFLYCNQIEVLLEQELKDLCWGSASMSPRNNWLKQGITLHKPDLLFAFGVNTPQVLFIHFTFKKSFYFPKITQKMHLFSILSFF
jgi:hypothetical protein